MNNSRRTFIKQGSAVLAGAALLPSINLHAGASSRHRLGIQLFSMEKEMMNDARMTLESLRNSGYQYVEHSNYIDGKFYGFTPSDFRKLVIDCGLVLLSGHTVLEPKHWNKKNEKFTSEWRQVIADASVAGQEFLITPWLDKSLWDNETALKSFMDILNKCGELCRKSGIKFGYHNHDFEFNHFIRNKRLYDIILQYTDPYLVIQQLDIGNIHHQELPTIDLFKRYPGRFQMMHIKNNQLSETRHEAYKTAALDEGILDIGAIITAAKLSGGTSEFILDRANAFTASALESAHHDFEFMKHCLVLT